MSQLQIFDAAAGDPPLPSLVSHDAPQIAAELARRGIGFEQWPARVALAAEALGHHPDWSNVWNRVSIALETHDLGGLSTLDLQLAARIDSLA